MLRIRCSIFSLVDCVSVLRAPASASPSRSDSVRNEHSEAQKESTESLIIGSSIINAKLTVHSKMILNLMGENEYSIHCAAINLNIHLCIPKGPSGSPMRERNANQSGFPIVFICICARFRTDSIDLHLHLPFPFPFNLNCRSFGIYLFNKC